MKTISYAIFSVLLISLSAGAQAPENTATGATVVKSGFECDICQSGVFAGPIDVEQERAAAKARQSRSEDFLPGSSSVATPGATDPNATH